MPLHDDACEKESGGMVGGGEKDLGVRNSGDNVNPQKTLFFTPAKSIHINTRQG